MHVSIFIGAVLLILSGWTSSTQNNRTETAFIVQSDLEPEEFMYAADSIFGEGSSEGIYTALGIFKLEIPLESRTDAVKILSDWRENGWCNTYYTDQDVKLRALPDDPLYGEQWDMDRIDCPEAWDITTGGVTWTGDTIVVAVLDAGFNIDHIDMQRNTWINHHEVPGDGIDNDDNGYVDDYRGAYTAGMADDHPFDTHGTSVWGIIGADGNNRRGVTGINWNIKVMPVSGISKESEVIAAYQYVRTMRKLWNDTNGERGAFVVATNLSAGTDGEFGYDHPMWCAVYDDLGQLGVLNICSVTNNETFIDEDGDLPSTCQSEFLVAVTNTNRDDIRVMPSGYGKINVDLAAPGSGTFTTVANNNYSKFDGTSAAAPHVAGTVGLMYSVDCPEVMTLALQDPASAAVRMRSAILSNVNPLGSLTNTTSTGGRLETGAAVANVCSFFDSEIRLLEITRAYPVPTRRELTLEFVPASLSKHYVEVFDMTGRLVFSEEIYPTSNPFNYEVTVRSQVPGVYVAVISTENQDASVRFVIM